jgi:hypothetical protein
VTLWFTKRIVYERQFFFAVSRTYSLTAIHINKVFEMALCGGKWDKTLKTWVNALGVVQEKAGGQVNFRLFVIPRTEFLNAPDWGSERKLSWRKFTRRRKQRNLKLTLNLSP